MILKAGDLSQNKIVLGSLDLFWLPHVQKALSLEFETELYSTWSLKKSKPNPTLVAHNAFVLHYALQLYKMFPILQAQNYTYYALCLLFDEWFSLQVDSKIRALTFLSGFGLKAGRKVKKRGIPVIVECGSTHTEYQHRILKEEYKRNGLHYSLFPFVYRNRVKKEFEEADYIQIPSRFVGQTFLEYGVSSSKLLYAPYGVDLTIFSRKSYPDFNLPFRVICPSGVNLRKGARILAEAWKKLDWRDAELHWIGHPTQETKHLFNFAPEGITWHSHMSASNVATLFRQCDVMVLPSFEEGLARVVIEASACGLPCIVTPNTGAEDFFTSENPEGWLIPTNDVDSLCESLKKARADREATFTLGQRAADRAQFFSWDAYEEKVLKNYHHALSNGS